MQTNSGQNNLKANNYQDIRILAWLLHKIQEYEDYIV